jgi:hypothetical protein
MSTERVPSVPDTAVAADGHAKERLEDYPVDIEDEAGGVLAHCQHDGLSVVVFAPNRITEGALHEGVAAVFYQLNSHLHASGRYRGDRR